MRLLNVSTLEFAEFVGSNVPRYAIASHRWCAEEPTIEALVHRYNTTSDGYKKVEQFCRITQQWDPDIRWLWIDTCCVDKKSSAELQEVINSMFRWYAGAEVCFAFLHDVRPLEVGWRTVLGDLQRSVWFYRGWTLQELLAPRTVVFLNTDWEMIGHKGQFSWWPSENNLNEYVAATTGIPEEVLVDYNHSKSLTYETRLAWASRRTTTRVEDKAYCLLGIFDICMPLIYGEGDAAHTRLISEIRKAQSLTTERNIEQKLPVSKIPLAIKDSSASRRQRRLPMQTSLPRDLPPPLYQPKFDIAPSANRNRILEACLENSNKLATLRNEMPLNLHKVVSRKANDQAVDRQSSQRPVGNPARSARQDVAAVPAEKHQAEPAPLIQDEAVLARLAIDDRPLKADYTTDVSSDEEGSDGAPAVNTNRSAILYASEEGLRNGPNKFSPDQQEERARMEPPRTEPPRQPRPSSPPTVEDEEATDVPPLEPHEYFPRAFERWEALSAHWEGLMSFWLHRLDQNTEPIRTTVPNGNQMARQITDLSAAGANLFHAVVELQRLRASSERKFQRWFFESQTELEQQREVEGALRRELELERGEKESLLLQLKEIREADEEEQLAAVHACSA